MFPSPVTLIVKSKNYSVSTDRTSIVVHFKGKEIYDAYKDIIFQNYDQNQFVQKIENDNIGTIEYNFKFRGGEVCITLDRSNSALYINGNGQDKWFKEAAFTASNGILDIQYERFQSRDLQIPGPKTGENKKPLVNVEDFRKCFAIPYAYGTYGNRWSHETILLYKYSTNATTKYWEIPENTWKKIVNKHHLVHAELLMIKDLDKIQDYLTIQPDDYEGSYKGILSVEVIISYSPCYDCAQALCKKTKDLKQIKAKNDGCSDTVVEKLSALSLRTEINEEEKIKFKITFSNFYKHLEHYRKNHIEGLKDLLKSDIKLDVFTNENWDYFFNAAGLVTERPWRRRRERDDKTILQYLEELVAFDRMQAALKASELDMRKHELL